VSTNKSSVTPKTSLLTQRERDVLRWISLGASNKEVARKLAISPSTVRTHVESVFRKLECTTRAAATLKATQLGLL
jgi:DNA-binding CsgD family transcriptional regulator